MTKVVTIIALMLMLSACHAGFGIGDSGQHPTYAATDPYQSAVAQASVGTTGKLALDQVSFVTTDH